LVRHLTGSVIKKDSGNIVHLHPYKTDTQFVICRLTRPTRLFGYKKMSLFGIEPLIEGFKTIL